MARPSRMSECECFKSYAFVCLLSLEEEETKLEMTPSKNHSQALVMHENVLSTPCDRHTTPSLILSYDPSLLSLLDPSLYDHVKGKQKVRR